ncbi:MAG: hypothetical protein GPJ54_21020 [Candidatus Heimdallarchaeota archaeon]|nr:hypothetical protein [Candidatus Heimdallarchaeota archaeon]
MNVLRLVLIYIRVKMSFRFWSRSRLEKYQLNQILKRLSQLKKSEYYYKHISENPTMEDFYSLPIIHKKEFMDNLDDIITLNTSKKELLEFAVKNYENGNMGLYMDKYSIGLSSGTSGNKTLTVLGPKDRLAYGAIMFARNGVYGLFKRRVLFCLRVNNPAYMEMSKYGFTIFFRDYTHSIDDLIELINKEQINIIAGPPSLLLAISKKSNSITTKIRSIVSYAETLSQIEKEQIRNELGSPVSQIYQGAEGFLAHTCKKGSLHLNEDMVYFEFETVDETQPLIKNVIITDLHRTILPVIRYKLNDLIELNHDKCSCGSSFQVVKQIHGRKDDVFYIKRGKEYVMLFPDYIRRSINQASDKILEYQAIQKTLDLIEIRIIIDGDRADIEKKIKSNLQGYANDLSVELPKIVFSEDPPMKNKRSLKLIRVLREIPQPN